MVDHFLVLLSSMCIKDLPESQILHLRTQYVADTSFEHRVYSFVSAPVLTRIGNVQ